MKPIITWQRVVVVVAVAAVAVGFAFGGLGDLAKDAFSVLTGLVTGGE